jgi:hypothetical protein
MNYGMQADDRWTHIFARSSMNLAKTFSPAEPCDLIKIYLDKERDAGYSQFDIVQTGFFFCADNFL